MGDELGFSPTEGIVGSWKSTDAMGNTSLDWTSALKAKQAVLYVEFYSSGKYKLKILGSGDASSPEITSTFKHLVATEGTYGFDGELLKIAGDQSGLEWHWSRDDASTLMLRLVGARRWGRCKGVDVLYFERLEELKD